MKKTLLLHIKDYKYTIFGFVLGMTLLMLFYLIFGEITILDTYPLPCQIIPNVNITISFLLPFMPIIVSTIYGSVAVLNINSGFFSYMIAFLLYFSIVGYVIGYIIDTSKARDLKKKIRFIIFLYLACMLISFIYIFFMSLFS